MTDVLDKALGYTLQEEGGWSNNASDHGGETMWGITQKTLTLWNAAHSDLGYPESVKDLTQDQAKEIYRINYWRWDFVSDPAMAIKCFDTGVNCGVMTAIKILQRAVGTFADGNIGPLTTQAVNAANPKTLMAAFVEQQKAYYYGIVARDSSQSVFLKGWLKRSERIPVV